MNLNIRCIRGIRPWLAFLGCLLGLSVAHGQNPAPPPPSVTLGQPTYATVFDSTRPATGPVYDSLEDRNGSILVGNELLDGPRNRLGWFADAEVDYLGSHVNNELIAPVAVGALATTVALPSARLDWTASPRIEIGYRCGQAAGDLSLSYRYLGTTGTDLLPAFDAAGNPCELRSRLEMHIADLDYSSLEPSWLPGCEMTWRIGVRGESMFFDSQALSPLRQEHVRNAFGGAGPHAALEIWHPVHASSFGVYSKVDVAGVLGQVRQEFDEAIAGVGVGAASQHQTMPSMTLDVEAGFGWTPCTDWRITAGYLYMHFWDAAYAINSRGDATTQGVFLRAEWRY
jgi:hypothetical protein